ncbi:MAG: tetratricopeptide repeat protein [Clostridiaceae bacterium]
MKNLPIIDIILVAATFILIASGYPTLGNFFIVIYLGYMIYKNIPTILASKGSRAYNKGDKENALKYFEKAVKHKQSKPYIKSSYGYLLLREGRVEEAEPYLIEASEYQAKDSRFHFNSILNLAILNWKKGDIDKGIKLVEDIKEQYKNTIMYEILGYLYISKGDYKKALEFNQEAYDFNPDDNVIGDNLAQSHFFLGEYDQAEKIYDVIIDFVKFPEAFYYYGIIQWKKGNYVKAYDAFEHSLTMKNSFLSNVKKEDVELKFNQLKEELALKGIDIETLREEENSKKVESEKLESEKQKQLADEKENTPSSKDHEYKVD